MKIGRKIPGRTGAPGWIWLGALLIAFAAGVAMGERGLSRSLADYWTTVTSNLGKTAAEDTLPTLVVDMAFDNYNNILDQRREAMETGVFIAAEADFQPAAIRLDGVETPVRLRLDQGPAAHLGEDEKWNFDVRTRDDRLLLGMRRFYLVDPADHNWLNEWAFQQALAREDLLSTQYRFVHLFLNGVDRGIYAVQQGLGPELPRSQDRPPGVVVEFDATRLWESVAYFDGEGTAARDDPVTHLTASDFQYFEVDTFRDAAIAQDERLSAQKDRAIGLLRSLQSGELSAAELFDVQRYGRFLALVDLWGATDATTLVNLRYYFNPDSGRLEPIGFRGNPLPTDDPDGGRLSLTVTYNDPDLQAAYVRSAQRLSQPDYLDQLQAELEEELSRLQQAVRTEITLSLPWEALRRRQLQIQRSLNPLQPVFAYLGPPELATEAIIQVDVANVLSLPVEILGFDIAGVTFMEVDHDWIQGNPGDLLLLDGERVVLRGSADDDSAVLRYVRFHLPVAEIVKVDRELDTMRDPEIRVATRILGLDRRVLTLARPGYPELLADPSQGADGDG